MRNTAWPYQTMSGLSTLWICLRYISFFTNLFCILKSSHARCVAGNILSIIRMHRVLPVLSFFHFPFSPFFFLTHKNNSKLVFLWQLWAKMNEWKSISGRVKNSSPISPSSTRHKRMSLWNLVPEGCIIGQKSLGPVCDHECWRGWSSNGLEWGLGPVMNPVSCFLPRLSVRLLFLWLCSFHSQICKSASWSLS